MIPNISKKFKDGNMFINTIFSDLQRIISLKTEWQGYGMSARLEQVGRTVKYLVLLS